MKFVFLLTIWASQGDAPQMEIADYNLTAGDCTARMVSYAEANPGFTEGVPSCELASAELADIAAEQGKP